jgi:putative copper export protein
MTILIAVIHAGLAAAWVGGMAYSLLVVQPKLQNSSGLKRTAARHSLQ